MFNWFINFPFLCLSLLFCFASLYILYYRWGLIYLLLWIYQAINLSKENRLDLRLPPNVENQASKVPPECRRLFKVNHIIIIKDSYILLQCNIYLLHFIYIVYFSSLYFFFFDNLFLLFLFKYFKKKKYFYIFVFFFRFFFFKTLLREMRVATQPLNFKQALSLNNCFTENVCLQTLLGTRNSFKKR